MNRKSDDGQLISGAQAARIGLLVAMFAAAVTLAQLILEGIAGSILGSALVGGAGAILVLRYRASSGAVAATALLGTILASMLMGGATTYALRGEGAAPDTSAPAPSFSMSAKEAGGPEVVPSCAETTGPTG